MKYNTFSDVLMHLEFQDQSETKEVIFYCNKPDKIITLSYVPTKTQGTFFFWDWDTWQNENTGF